MIRFAPQMIYAVIVGLALVAFSFDRTSSPNSTGGIWFPTDKPNCLVWNPTPQLEETATWSGDCLNGKAHGLGNTTWRWKKSGKWVVRHIDGYMNNGRLLGEVTITDDAGVWVGKLMPNGYRGAGTYTNR